MIEELIRMKVKPQSRSGMWVIDGLMKLGEIKPEAIDEVLEDVKERSPRIFESLVHIAYLDGEISLAKAAELLEVTRVELHDQFKEKGVPIKELTEVDVVAEVGMMRARN